MKKLEVAQYYVLGYTYGNIENETDMSHGSIVNTVKELEYAKLIIPGTPLNQLNDLSQVSVQLKKQRLDPS